MAKAIQGKRLMTTRAFDGHPFYCAVCSQPYSTCDHLGTLETTEAAQQRHARRILREEFDADA